MHNKCSLIDSEDNEILKAPCGFILRDTLPLPPPSPVTMGLIGKDPASSQLLGEASCSPLSVRLPIAHSYGMQCLERGKAIHNRWAYIVTRQSVNTHFLIIFFPGLIQKGLILRNIYCYYYNSNSSRANSFNNFPDVLAVRTVGESLAGV